MPNLGGRRFDFTEFGGGTNQNWSCLGGVSTILDFPTEFGGGTIDFHLFYPRYGGGTMEFCLFLARIWGGGHCKFFLETWGLGGVYFGSLENGGGTHLAAEGRRFGTPPPLRMFLAPSLNRLIKTINSNTQA